MPKKTTYSKTCEGEMVFNSKQLPSTQDMSEHITKLYLANYPLHKENCISKKSPIGTVEVVLTIFEDSSNTEGMEVINCICQDWPIYRPISEVSPDLDLVFYTFQTQSVEHDSDYFEEAFKEAKELSEEVEIIKLKLELKVQGNE